ncbi:hypothetical protein F4679DRAFT_581906 [Xylaria curta]|nr:hypothetical protein F4679DRAFT_581906 [Xylaria curta]
MAPLNDLIREWVDEVPVVSKVDATPRFITDSDENSPSFNQPSPLRRRQKAGQSDSRHQKPGKEVSEPARKMPQTELTLDRGQLPYVDIITRKFNEETFARLPGKARDLIRELIFIYKSSSGIIPAIICKDVERLDTLMDHNFDNDYYLTKIAALGELRRLREVIRNALNCDEESESEPAWNAFVHWNIFKIALAKPAGKTVKPFLVTTAAIAPGLCPKTNILDGDGDGKVVPKMVDFCLTIEPNDLEQVQLICSRQPCGRDTINQSTYPPLRHRPIAIAVDTKVET